MRFDTQQHPYDCGIDLHARTRDVCLLAQGGDTLLHRHMPATPEALLKAIAPYRDQLVMAAECLLPWYWLADFWAAQRRPFVLGHARYLQAIPGGKAKHDKRDAHQLAVLLRGGMRPQASVDPAERRATRALRRRRTHLARTRGELLAPVQHTTSQSKLPASGKKIASKTTRDGGAERFADPAVPKSLDGDLALIGADDDRLRDVARTLVNTAQHHEAKTLELRPTVPGIGQRLSRVRRYESPPIDRCPRGQDCASSGRLVTCAKASAGKRAGTSGTTIGKAPLTWACSEAAVFFWREQPAGQQSLASWEKNHHQGKALTILAPQLARAVYDRLKHKTACDRHKLLTREGRGVGELDAELDAHGRPLTLYALHETHDCGTERRCASRALSLRPTRD
jgi:hypothetical protein